LAGLSLNGRIILKCKFKRNESIDQIRIRANWRASVNSRLMEERNFMQAQYDHRKFVDSQREALVGKYLGVICLSRYILPCT
jgi:hypothetical protein